MQVLFRVNNELIELTQLSDDEGAQGNLKNDDAYSSQLLKELAATGQIMVTQPITRITRFTSESEELLIYEEGIENLDPTPAVGNDNSETCEPVEQSCLGLTTSVDTENCDPNSQFRNTQCDLWKDDETAYMLDQFHDYLQQIGPMKKFKTKKSMWERLSEDIKNKFSKTYSPTQIENRYKTVIRRKKDAIIHNSKTGRSRQEVPFDPELSKIAAIDDSIQPAVIRGAKRVNMLKQSPQVDSDADSDVKTPEKEITKAARFENSKKPAKRNKSPIIAETLQKINQQKKAARQERHREKMELIRELFKKK